MDLALVLDQILDIPPAFRRPSVPYSWLVGSLAGGITSYTQASDGGELPVAGIPTAFGAWLDVWGQIYNLPRLGGEADAAYQARIVYTLTSPVVPPLAIQTWSRLFLGTNAVYVTESLPTVGYAISIPAGLPVTLIQNWISGLVRIRPAGVPFTVNTQVGPLMLGTYSYIGSTGLAGAYLGAGASRLNLSAGTSTLNATPAIATVLLTDPLLNGGVSLGLPGT